MRFIEWTLFLVVATMPVPLAASITLSAASIDFGSVFVSENSAGRTLAVTNTGSEGVSVAVDHACGSQGFEVRGLCGDLEPGGSCKLLSSFSPIETGHFHCSVRVRSSGGQNQSISLLGTGLSHPRVVAHHNFSGGTQRSTPKTDSALQSPRLNSIVQRETRYRLRQA